MNSADGAASGLESWAGLPEIEVAERAILKIARLTRRFIEKHPRSKKIVNISWEYLVCFPIFAMLSKHILIRTDITHERSLFDWSSSGQCG